jgi:hypothetical protein
MSQVSINCITKNLYQDVDQYSELHVSPRCELPGHPRAMHADKDKRFFQAQVPPHEGLQAGAELVVTR